MAWGCCREPHASGPLQKEMTCTALRISRTGARCNLSFDRSHSALYRGLHLCLSLMLMTEGLLEAWQVHDEINLFLLDRIPDGGFRAVTLLKNGQPSTGRNVAKVFAHMHAVRVSHVGRDFLKNVPRFETGAEPGRAELVEAFRASGHAVAGRIARIVEMQERIKDRHGIVLLGYLISHESHHRGQILLALKQSGIRMPEEFRFRIWEHWFRPKLQ